VVPASRRFDVSGAQREAKRFRAQASMRWEQVRALGRGASQIAFERRHAYPDRALTGAKSNA